MHSGHVLYLGVYHTVLIIDIGYLRNRFNRLVFKTNMESVLCEVRTEVCGYHLDELQDVKAMSWLTQQLTNLSSRRPELILPIPVAERSAADRLFGSRVRIPQGAWMFVLRVVSKDKTQNAEQSV